MKARILAVLAALVLSANCSAAFPERAVTLIAPFPAGGAADVIARRQRDWCSLCRQR